MGGVLRSWLGPPLPKGGPRRLSVYHGVGDFQKIPYVRLINWQGVPPIFNPGFPRRLATPDEGTGAWGRAKVDGLRRWLTAAPPETPRCVGGTGRGPHTPSPRGELVPQSEVGPLSWTKHFTRSWPMAQTSHLRWDHFPLGVGCVQLLAHALF